MRREGQIIKDTDCVNRCVAGRIDREYYEDNYNRIKTMLKEYNDEHNGEIKQKRKQYYMENKDEILQKQKERYSNKFEEIQKYKQEYHIKHRDKINEKVKKHYEENKEHYKEYKRQWALKNKETITCICGCNCLKVVLEDMKKQKTPRILKIVRTRLIILLFAKNTIINHYRFSLSLFPLTL